MVEVKPQVPSAKHLEASFAMPPVALKETYFHLTAADDTKTGPYRGLAGGIVACFPSAAVRAFDESEAQRFENGDAARGEQVFLAGQCASCHASPGQGDRTRLGGGLPLASPFGAFNVPNISADPDDGIGR